MTEPADDITLDGLLGQQIRLRQPRQSYRAGSDAILLAATVPARPGQTVLDAGAGVGAIALCLAHRCRQVTVRGLELQPRLAELANENAQANSLADRVSVHQGDIRRAPSEIAQARFDHTVCNPPFHPEGRSSPSPDDGKALAHGEGETPLADWLAFCLKRTRPGGTISLIHRAERLPDLLAGLGRGAGDLVILPLWPGPDRPARRVIVQATAQARGPAVLLPGLMMHQADGEDSEAARAVLRRGEALDLVRPR